MARILYTFVYFLALPVIVLRLWVRGIKLPSYRKRMCERFGSIDERQTERLNKKTVWIHTVSVGEFIAAKPLIDKLLSHAELAIVITTTTPTGSQQVVNCYGSKVYHCYAPYDLPFFIRRFLKKTQPAIAIFVETELWPNTVFCCQQKNIPTLLINARLSEKSAKGYDRFSSLTRPMLDALTAASIQHKQDAQRFYDLGLKKSKSRIVGNIKFDITLAQPTKELAGEIKASYSNAGKRKIFIAASTHPGEDEIILDAISTIKKKHPNLLLMLVPRHPDRFNDVFNLCEQRGLKTLRRSENPIMSDPCDVVLCDTMGELGMLYGVSDIAFIGGSLVPNGGHNAIEAAAWAVPLLGGPSQFNFFDISKQFDEAGALTIVANARELSTHLALLLENEKYRQQCGEAALSVVKSNTGALEKTYMLILSYINKFVD